MDEMIYEKIGNAPEYSSDKVEHLAGSLLEGKRVLFLGSSVTYGECSEQDGIPEYFAKRFNCSFTKEAVSGTTLVDSDETSYVSRLVKNTDTADKYDLFICQLSTNDATQQKPLGTVDENCDGGNYDKTTIAGAIEFIINYVKAHWDCPIMFYTGSRYDSKEYDLMVNMLYEIAEKWGIGVIDLWRNDTFNDIAEEDRNIYMNDPVHPRKAGYMKWWCPEIERQVLGYMANVRA